MRNRVECPILCLFEGDYTPFEILAQSDWAYTNKVVLIGLERQDAFAIYLGRCSETGWRHFRERGCEDGLTLCISGAIAKFPTPECSLSDAAITAAIRFNVLAVGFSANDGCGLTDAMNVMHTPGNADPQISELRELLVTMDREVISAYGWTDLDISYEFQKFDDGSANDPWRWGFCDETTAEILGRLILLNKERYTKDLEDAANKFSKQSAPDRRRRRISAVAPKRHDDLFDGSEV